MLSQSDSIKRRALYFYKHLKSQGKYSIGIKRQLATLSAIYGFSLLGINFSNCTERSGNLANLTQKVEIQSYLPSISPTFYARLFLYERSAHSFFLLAVKVKLFICARILAQMRS
jgi:hypothetical protein